MNKKILIAFITVSFLLASCGKAGSTSTLQQNEQPPLALSSSNNTSAKSPEKTTPSTDAAIDYSQYTKKTWVLMADNNSLEGKVYFSISKVDNGKVTGKLSAINFASTDKNLLSFEAGFDGMINKDTAECQFSDQRGNIKLTFKANNKMGATITLIDKSKNTIQPPEGTFEFVPDNIKNVKGFEPIENQSFTVSLNSWGDVNFVSGKLIGGNHIPVLFYLTNKAGDILYNFNAALPYSVDVTAVSFADVNKDGLKDIFIIVTDNYDGSKQQIAAVYLQKANGEFANDAKLNSEINSSGNNKDIKAIVNYLSQKF